MNAQTRRRRTSSPTRSLQPLERRGGIIATNSLPRSMMPQRYQVERFSVPYVRRRETKMTKILNVSNLVVRQRTTFLTVINGPR
jgi:hypothetical protein